MAAYTWSEAERVEQCPASAVLPRVHTTNADAERGRAIHSFLTRRIGGMPGARALALVPEPLRPTCAAIRLRPVLSGLRHVRGEVSYAVDVEYDVAHELGVDLDRRYPRTGPSAICGTLDVEGVGMDDVPVVGDFKTGFRSVTPAAENPQLMLEARARQLVTGAPVIAAWIGYVRPSGYVHLDRARFTRFDLEVFSDRQNVAIARVEEARQALTDRRPLSVSTGEWCRYCPCMVSCPAYTGLARRMLPELDAIKGAVALTPVQAGAAWTRAKTIMRLADTVINNLNEMSRRVPLPTTPGKAVGPVEYERTWFQQDRAIALLRSLGATTEQIESCTSTTTTVQYRELRA